MTSSLSLTESNLKRQEILNYIYHSKTINNIFSSIIKDKTKRNLMKSDCYLAMCELKPQILIVMYENGKIDGYIATFILNQWNSNTSNYYKDWKNGGFRKSLTRDYDEVKYDNMIDEEIQETYHKYVKDIDTILDSTHWYHKTLFQLYFTEGHTYKEIESMTGINFRSVALSVNKTLDIIRKELKNKYPDEL